MAIAPKASTSAANAVVLLLLASLGAGGQSIDGGGAIGDDEPRLLTGNLSTDRFRFGPRFDVQTRDGGDNSEDGRTEPQGGEPTHLHVAIPSSH